MRRMKLSKKYGGLQFFAGGETWVLNNSLSGVNGAGKTYSCSFVSNGVSYSSIRLDPDKTLEDELLYDSTTVYYYNWKNQAYRTIAFSEPPTGALLTWLQANGTKQANKVVETSLRFGADALAKAYLGADSLDRIYLGTDLLYQTLNEYTVTETLSNVTTIGTHPVKILEGKSLTLKYVADANYELPDSVTVAGATSNWTKSTGTLVVSNPTGDVTITITAVRITYSITENLTNVAKVGTHPSVIAAGQTLVLNYAAATGYNLPDTVTVTGATSDWKPATGALIITNPTGAVTITIAGVQPKLAAPTNLSVSDDTLSFDKVANAEQYEVFAGSNSIGTYEPGVKMVAGTYKWGDKVNNFFEAVGVQELSFTSNSEQFTAIEFAAGEGGRFYYKNSDGAWITVCTDDYFWNAANPAYQTIVLATDQEVSKEWYTAAITKGRLVKQ